MKPLTIYSYNDIIIYALKNNCSRQVYDLLIALNNRSVNFLFIIYLFD